MEAGFRESLARLSRLAGKEDFEFAVVLGSGLGELAEEAEEAVVLPYEDLPFLPQAKVPGHRGRLVAGVLEGRRVLLFQGRHHLYEGYDARQVSAGIRLAREAGCRRLLLSNASGAINRSYRSGDIMFLADHINLLGDNPLRGIGGAPFLDLSELYRQDLFSPLLAYAQSRGVRLHRGVLAAMPGPSYETPAEIRMLHALGGDVVSMSTVPEAIMGKYLGMEVVGLSLVANAAAGLGDCPLAHEDVLQTARRSAGYFPDLVRRLIRIWVEGEGAGEGETTQTMEE